MKIRHVTAMAAVLATASAATAAAQAPGADMVKAATLAAAGSKFLPAFCSASKNPDNRTTYVQNQLKTALEDKDAAKRGKALDEAYKAAGDAARANAKSGGAWYYYGRTAMLKGEPEIADSAFRTAVKLVPDCETDIDQMRQTAWAPVVNAAIDSLNAAKVETAIGLFRTANLLYDKRPEGVSRLGVAYYNAEKLDSAVKYFRKAIDVSGTDSVYAAERAQVRLYLGQTLARQNKQDEAVTVLEAQLKETPQDVRVMRALAASYRATGKAAEAGKLEEDSRKLGMTKSADEGGVSANDLFNDAVNLFNEKKYAEAADLFDKVLQLDPYNRDALFNKANAYLAGGDAKGLVAAARQLIAREPLGEINHKLLIQGLRDLSDQDGLMKAAEAYLPLPVNLEIKSVQSGSKGGTVSGTITGREAKDLNGKVVPAAPMTVQFQFMDNTGATVATADVAVPVLAAGQAMEFKADSKGVAFAGYKYVRK